MEPNENLFELTGVGVVQTDMATGRFVRVNQAFCEMVGYSETELQGMTNAELTHPDDWARDQERFAALQRGEAEEDISLSRVLHKDGHEVWLELSITVMGEGEQAVNLTIINDVTERKRAEEALRDSEARFRGLVEPFAQAVWETDAAGQVVMDSPSWRAYTGQSLESWLGEGWVQAVHPDDQTYALEQWREAVRAGTVVDAEFRLRSPDGGWRWTNVRAVPLLRDDGTVERWAGLNLDISERKRAEEALSESEAKYRTLFEAIDEGFCIFELLFDDQGNAVDWVYTEANPAFEKQTGFIDPVGKHIGYFQPDLERSWFERFAEIARTGEPVRFAQYTEAMGIYYDVYALRVGEAGENRVSLLFTDITKRKQAEASLTELNEILEQQVKVRTQELERSNIRFTQAFTLAPFPALISTMSKPETFLEVNEAFLELTRYSREEIVGKETFELKMWSSTNDQRKLVEAQKDGKGFRDLELQLLDKEGNALDVLLSAEVIRIDGHHGYLKMFYDVTEKKRTDEQMMQAVQSLMTDASWFSQGFVSRLNHIRSGGKIEDYAPIGLSNREREVLVMLARGWTNKRISEALDLKQQTIRNYISSIFDKLGVHSRTEAAVWARERGLIG